MKLLTRYFGPATGRHRKDAAPERLTVSLDTLLGPVWTAPPRPYGAAVTQDWADCPACGHATAGVRHADGRTCGECLTTTHAETALEARR